MSEEKLLEIRILAKTLETLHLVYAGLERTHIGAGEVIEAMSAVARRLRDVLESG